MILAHMLFQGAVVAVRLAAVVNLTLVLKEISLKIKMLRDMQIR